MLFLPECNEITLFKYFWVVKQLYITAFLILLKFSSMTKGAQDNSWDDVCQAGAGGGGNGGMGSTYGTLKS